MAGRKRKYILLRGKFGNFIVVERSWYERKGIGRKRGSNQMWVIAAQSDDHAMLQAMASLTGRHANKVNTETEGR
jgi:hypothetical protein